MSTTPLQSSSGDDTAPDSFVARRSGEDAVRRAAQVISSRTRGGEEGEKRTRRRSRRARSTPVLAGTGLQFHYVVGVLILFSLLAIAFGDRIGKKLWHTFRPAVAAPVLAPGQPPPPVVAAPWWFRVEIPVLVIGLLIWLYLTPGLWDKVKAAIGLDKEEKRVSRKRRSA